MGETTTHINATPEQVYAHLTKPMDDIEPGPLKVGNAFRMTGQDYLFTVTKLEPPNRFAYSMQSIGSGDFSVITEYTILPESGGSQVRVEMDSSSASSPLMGMIVGAFKEGSTEREVLSDLKAAMEAKPTG
jgi:hypothetical protein